MLFCKQCLFVSVCDDASTEIVLVASIAPYPPCRVSQASASNTNCVTPLDSARPWQRPSSGRERIGAGCVNTHTKLDYIRQLRTKHVKPGIRLCVNLWRFLPTMPGLGEPSQRGAGGLETRRKRCIRSNKNIQKTLD